VAHSLQPWKSSPAAKRHERVWPGPACCRDLNSRGGFQSQAKLGRGVIASMPSLGSHFKLRLSLLVSEEHPEIEDNQMKLARGNILLLKSSSSSSSYRLISRHVVVCTSHAHDAGASPPAHLHPFPAHHSDLVGQIHPFAEPRPPNQTPAHSAYRTFRRHPTNAAPFSMPSAYGRASSIPSTTCISTMAP
jgi:hypothetical protein